MKRFYCTICKKVKRVRRYPRDIVTPEAYDVMARTGTCTYHSLTFNTRTQSIKAGAR